MYWSRGRHIDAVAQLLELLMHEARNCRLPRASQAVQPEYALLVSFISPVEYLSEEIDAGIRKAGGIVLSLICIEWCICGGR